MPIYLPAFSFVHLHIIHPLSIQPSIHPLIQQSIHLLFIHLSTIYLSTHHPSTEWLAGLPSLKLLCEPDQSGLCQRAQEAHEVSNQGVVPMRLYDNPSIHIPFYPSSYPTIQPFFHPSFLPSLHLSIHPSTHPFFYPSLSPPLSFSTCLVLSIPRTKKKHKHKKSD